MSILLTPREIDTRNLITDEYLRAKDLFGKFKNAHEGYAVLLEEVEELWEVIKRKDPEVLRVPAMREEAVQVAAMAMRFLVDLFPEGSWTKAETGHNHPVSRKGDIA